MEAVSCWPMASPWRVPLLAWFWSIASPRLLVSAKLRELCIYVDMLFIFCRHNIHEHATGDQGIRTSDRLHAHVFFLPPLRACNMLIEQVRLNDAKF